MNTKYTYLIIPVFIILVCNVIWPPSQLMITDEVSYYFQLRNWLGGNIDNTIIDAVSNTTYTLIEGHYPPATSFVLSILFGSNSSLIYFSGLLYLLGTIYIMYQSLIKLNLPLIALSVIYLFIPLIFIARTTMSEMPSLLLVSWGVYLYIKNKPKSYLWLAFITGLSVAFRETNILLLAPMAFFISRNYIYSALAFLCGFSFRLIGYYVLTKNALLVKEGYPFGFEFLPDTLIVYAIVLLVLLPLSPVWFTKVPREQLKPFGLAIIMFLGLHLVYGYIAHEYSGYANGLILNGRFWIPALPIFIVSLGYFLKDKLWLDKLWVTVPLICIVTITNLGVHFITSQKQSEFIQFSKALDSTSKDELVFIDMKSRTPIFRYIYSYATDRKWSDIELVNNSVHTDQAFNKFGKFRVAIISSGATIAQSSRNSRFYLILSQLKEKYTVTKINEICTKSKSCLNIYEVTNVVH